MNLLIPLLTVLAIVLPTMSVFLLCRFILDRFLKRRLSTEPQTEMGSLTADVFPNTNLGWAERMNQAFDAYLKQTGIEWNPGQVLGLIALVCVTSAGLVLLWNGDTAFMAMAILLTVAASTAVLMFMRARWRRALQAQLPDAFFLLARSLRAGESFEQALETVAEHGGRPLADEFRRGADKIKLGLSVPAALRGMARRLDMPDFDIFVTAVTLHRTVGGNLTQLLDRVAISTRDRNLFRGYVLAATALSRVTGLFIAAAPPVLFFGYLIFQPVFITTFLQSTAGIRALWVAMGLEVVGIVWMYYLMRIDY